MVRVLQGLLLTVMIFFSSPAWAEKRVALVVGNAAYQHATPLINAVNDARDVAAALTELGFEVVYGADLDKRAFDLKVREFARVLDRANVGLFFYSGHGLQVKGVNYLVATDAKLEAERDLDFETARVEFVLSLMERAAKTNLVFLDACRTNPLARNLSRTMGTRSVDENRGLAPVASGLGTFIAFATQPGNVALDGVGRNSPFTGALKQQMVVRGASLTDIMIEVRRGVVEATKGAQVPWDHSSLSDRFYFTARPQEVTVAPVEVAPVTPPIAPAPARQSEAAEAWAAVKDTTSIGVAEAFITRFKDTFYAELARGRLEELKKQQQQQQLERQQQLALATPPPVIAPPPSTGIEGTYDVRGTNPGGGGYRGQVTITSSNGKYYFNWTISTGQTLSGSGPIGGGSTVTINWGQRYPVIYTVGSDGVLRGRWDNGRGTEDLYPRR